MIVHSPLKPAGHLPNSTLLLHHSYQFRRSHSISAQFKIKVRVVFELWAASQSHHKWQCPLQDLKRWRRVMSVMFVRDVRQVNENLSSTSICDIMHMTATGSGWNGSRQKGLSQCFSGAQPWNYVDKRLLLIWWISFNCPHNKCYPRNEDSDLLYHECIFYVNPSYYQSPLITCTCCKP